MCVLVNTITFSFKDTSVETSFLASFVYIVCRTRKSKCMFW